MKKIISIIAIALFTLTLTGCGNKDLEAICKAANGEIMTINFKNNKIVKIVSELTKTYEDETLLNMAYQSTQMTAEAYNTVAGSSAEVTKKDNSITMKLTFDVSKMTKEEIDEADLDDKPKEFIKDVEEEGYTCTIK